MRRAHSFVVLTAIAALLPHAAIAQAAPSPFDALHFREIGPAATGGRIHDLQIDPQNPAVLYVGTASGGIWKSANNGVTWKDIFAGQPDNTFGALAIFAGDSKIVWAGSGEQNNRQSSSWGGGVYRSTNGGDTWTYLGLHDTRSIGRVVLHPTDANIAYVAAVGNLWRGNPDRGVFKTTNAGRSWTKVLFVDTLTGATDLVMDPRDPNVLYAATYQRLRKAYGFNGGGPGSAIYKSTDAGATWKKLENGFPTGDKGRIGLALAASAGTGYAAGFVAARALFSDDVKHPAARYIGGLIGLVAAMAVEAGLVVVRAVRAENEDKRRERGLGPLPGSSSSSSSGPPLQRITRRLTEAELAAEAEVAATVVAGAATAVKAGAEAKASAAARAAAELAAAEKDSEATATADEAKKQR